jgi:hypothetical protein
MNNGVLGFPAQRADLGPLHVRAALKLAGTGDTVNAASGAGPSANFQYARSAIKSELNIEKVFYNATGDFTVHFAVPMLNEHFLCVATAKQNGGTEYLCVVHTSDTGVADRKRFIVVTRGAGTATNIAEVHLLFFA